MEKRREIARILAKRYSENDELSNHSIDLLTNLLEPMRFYHGMTLVKEGELCKYLYYVDRGLLHHIYCKEGKKATVKISYEGCMIICADSLFKQEPSNLTIKTLEPCKLYALNYNDFMMACHSSFEFCNLFLSMLKESLFFSQERRESLRFANAQERYEKMLLDYPDIVRRTPLKIVASYLEMSPETLSRIRKLKS